MRQRKGHTAVSEATEEDIQPKTFQNSLMILNNEIGGATSNNIIQREKDDESQAPSGSFHSPSDPDYDPIADEENSRQNANHRPIYRLTPPVHYNHKLTRREKMERRHRQEIAADIQRGGVGFRARYAELKARHREERNKNRFNY